jgi:TonB family protein
MFTNLIESNLHTNEFKRRGSFFLYTIAAYALLFVVAGVGSIYAYDAQLDEQENLEITMLQPIELPGPPKAPDAHPASAPKQTSRDQVADMRVHPIANINQPVPTLPPVSAKPVADLPVRTGVPTVIGSHDSNGTGPLVPTGNGTGGPGTVGPTRIEIDPGTPPLPPPTPKPTPKPVLHKDVINSEALSLPKPIYTNIAKVARADGTVTVQILIDERGKVISAHALGGHPLLTGEAIKAAMQARFSPTMIGDTPVKVSGFIKYNFVLQ